jgi:hypothetical protein
MQKIRMVRSQEITEEDHQIELKEGYEQDEEYEESKE